MSKKYRFSPVYDIESLRRKEPKELLKLLNVSRFKIPFIAVDLKRSFKTKLSSLSFISGMKETFIALNKDGFTLGIVTSNSKTNVESFLETNGINFIDFVHGDVGIFGKARKLQAVIKNSGYTIDEVIYIGDEVRDIEAAKIIGIKVIAVTWGFNNKEALEKKSPDYIVSKPNQITDIAREL